MNGITRRTSDSTYVDMGLNDLLYYIEDYEPQYKILILKAFKEAAEKHANVIRKSGVPYICHPITVACILAEMHADADTIAAGLLHDTIEDTDETYENIQTKFNSTIAHLVDGVTKLPKFKFDDDKYLANEETKRKLLESLTQDIRIIIIKLADRLHNMRTLNYHKPEKQIEISKETLEFYVPLASLIGAYTFKKELEDLSFKYLKPNEYKNLCDLIRYEKITNGKIIDQFTADIGLFLSERNVQMATEPQFKSIYGLYRRLKKYNDIDKVHDMLAVKIMVNDVETCYWLRDKIREMYKTIPEFEKDFIANPKTNMYRSLHETLEIDGQKLQVQIKTPEMYMINAYGLPAYWAIMSLQNPAEKMQKDVSNLGFFQLLKELINTGLPTVELNKLIKEEVLSSDINVYTPNNEVIELPLGATPVDFAYKIHSDLGNYIVAAIVNGKRVPLDYKLKDQDNIEIIYDKNLYGPRINIETSCNTEYAKRKIREFKRKTR